MSSKDVEISGPGGLVFFTDNRYHHNEGFVYRGQADVSWSLRPSLARIALAAGLDSREALDVERRITDEFKSRAHLYAAPALLLQGGSERDDLWWWSLMQHHGAPTRMLDWTRSPLVAVYFAAADGWDRDGVVWGFSHTSLRSAMEKAHSGCRAGFRLRMHDAPENLSVIDPRIKSERLVAQQGLLAYSDQILADHGSVLDNAPWDATRARQKYIIKASAKPAIVKQLGIMNITSAGLFPGIDGLCRSLADIARTHKVR